MRSFFSSKVPLKPQFFLTPSGTIPDARRLSPSAYRCPPTPAPRESAPFTFLHSIPSSHLNCRYDRKYHDRLAEKTKLLLGLSLASLQEPPALLPIKNTSSSLGSGFLHFPSASRQGGKPLTSPPLPNPLFFPHLPPANLFSSAPTKNTPSA